MKLAGCTRSGKKSRWWLVAWAVSVVLWAACYGAGVEARSKPPARKASVTGKKAPKAPAPDTEPRNNDISSICVEAETGLVISETDADRKRPPASMVKMIMMLLVAEGIHTGKWSLDTPIQISPRAQDMGGTQVFLKQGETFPLGQLVAAIAVHSANDASMAIAEGLWGSEEAYKEAANARVAELGMANTVFRSVHGLPPDKGQLPDETTARDMARLGQYCVLDPLILEWTSRKELQFRPDSAVEFNTNKLLWPLDGSEQAGGIRCDGIKTGYTRSAGYCLTASAVKDGIRLVAVVMGADGLHDRFALTRKLLEESFAKVTRKQVVKKGEPLGTPVRVANCETPRLQLVAGDDFAVVVTKDDVDKLVVAPQLPDWIQPPVEAGRPIGEAKVMLGEKALARIPAVASQSLVEAGWRWKLIQSIVPLANPEIQ
ncbi:MAG TPA: D-alanyl-D-alanine carboxypeptidase family protein [Candidatus Hydrogenedentes bacterium]|nr:D-alanyl-D-alanine carboxypeptidase family protein [Candidatus Hydrogenedentota bacterium]HOV76188.1 D-alanyl-D-alanine carboxypeptidase family protein [Candidatus Hydrogenedentota bacterium]HPC17472.1 D-alanyl-D-alanine carboxypeptidase family protein [Candidatus Hydrogenedentota bacterium]HRT20064.1 D-alanyl-D-alanine carboxypeptidase family protein [Candidatus Hydrogenedentota bacterium]HRT64872.1 D-alanyl-D-alanine carboxypeptidase family protein [Candidatus Hydrogenedentota bacterium]